MPGEYFSQRSLPMLLRIKVQAYTKAAVESHQSGDDTLTNLVVQRDLLAQADTVPPPGDWSNRRAGFAVAWPSPPPYA